MKKNIIAARENKCKFCDGTAYKLKTSIGIGIVYQCSKCGSLYRYSKKIYRLQGKDIYMINKIDELKKIGFYEVDDEYVKEHMHKQSIEMHRSQGKKIILARKIDDIIIFYSDEYIRNKTIDDIKKYPKWLD